MIFSWNSRFYLGISSPGILASKYSQNSGWALGSPPGLQGAKQRKISEFGISIPTFQIFPAPSFGETGPGVEIPVYPDPDDIPRIGNREQGLGIPGFSGMRLEMPFFPGIW